VDAKDETAQVHDASFVSNAVWRAPRLSPEELKEYTIPDRFYRSDGCWTCGGDHRSPECDVAFLSSEVGEKGTVNFQRLAEACIGNRTTKTAAMQEFQRRMALMKANRRFKGVTEEEACKAAQRWQTFLGQATHVMQTAMAAKKLA
jgi:hypothetical protein